MFAITKLGKDSQSFITELTALNASRGLCGTLALARALTFCSPLPASPVEDVDGFFRTHVQLSIENTLNTINELMIVDVKSVMEYALKFYKMRYFSAHPTCSVFSFNTATAIEDFFSISRSVDAAALEVIKAEAEKVSIYLNKFLTLIEELQVTPGTPDSLAPAPEPVGGIQ